MHADSTLTNTTKRIVLGIGLKNLEYNIPTALSVLSKVITARQ
jgi:hypothetical protein